MSLFDRWFLNPENNLHAIDQIIDDEPVSFNESNYRCAKISGENVKSLLVIG